MSDTYARPGTQKLIDLRTELETGQIKVPRFQRDFVWDLNRAAGLIDSIIKGYPVGALIYWRTDEQLRDIRNLGRIGFNESDEGEKVNFVLDGQQRLTSIVAALNGVEVTLKDGTTRDFSSLRVQLTGRDDDEPIIIDGYPDDTKCISIPLTELWDRGGVDYDACEGEAKNRRDDLREQIRGYEIPKVTLFNAVLSVATDVFSRINTGGQELTVFEIMVAKTYDPEREFDLLEEYDDFKEELQSAGFDSVDATDLLQLISLMLERDCKKKTILDLNRDRFIDTWPIALENIRAAIDYIRTAFKIPVSRLLPYSSLVVPIALFFHGNDKKRPSKVQAELLSDFFWRAGWSERYSSSADSKLGQDLRAIEAILDEKRPRYDWAAPVELDYFYDTTFSASSAFCKTVLALLASLHPKKFDGEDLVNLQNDWMRRADSMNFHHVFPKAYLRKNEYQDWEANRILNISLVDDFLNKRIIRARPPSDYMADFSETNDSFAKTMKSHLIATSKNASIWQDDYERFLDERGEALVKLLKKKLIIEEDLFVVR